MIILPLDPHLVDAAVEFEDLGYLPTINSVEINHSHPPPHSAASGFDANLMISVFFFTKLNQILNVFRGRRTPPRENVGSVRRSPSAGPSDMLGLTP